MNDFGISNNVPDKHKAKHFAALLITKRNKAQYIYIFTVVVVVVVVTVLHNDMSIYRVAQKWHSFLVRLNFIIY